MLIETRRAFVREPEPSDLDALAAIFADPDVMRFIGKGGVLTRDDAKDVIDRERASCRERGYGQGVTVLRETGDMVGLCGLIVWPDIDGHEELEVAYLLARDHWGNDLATEVAAAIRDWARSELGRDRLVSCIYPDNGASIRVAEKIGMRYEKDFDYAGNPMALYAMDRVGEPVS